MREGGRGVKRQVYAGLSSFALNVAVLLLKATGAGDVTTGPIAPNVAVIKVENYRLS